MKEAAEAKAASKIMMSLSATTRNTALAFLVKDLLQKKEDIIAANQEDMRKAAGLPQALLHRLEYGPEKIATSITQIKTIIGLADPLFCVKIARKLDSGLLLQQVSTPLGVLAFIFESRPDALIQVASLCIKSGNALLAKGGSEATNTNQVLAKVIVEASKKAAFPDAWFCNLEGRKAVQELLATEGLVDLLVPRGSKNFVSEIMRSSLIPVLGHAEGICHIYVDKDVDIHSALTIIKDSKLDYPAACNAVEVLLLDKALDTKTIMHIVESLQQMGVFLELCPETWQLYVANQSNQKNAHTTGIQQKEDQNWAVEYLDKRMAIKLVQSLENAIQHINTWGSGHTDTICCCCKAKAEKFLQHVDSSSVFWNASTRFSDGYRYGLGAELGISTGKLHARGPVGLEGLVSYKWVLRGKGHIVADYTKVMGSSKRTFIHKNIKRIKK